MSRASQRSTASGVAMTSGRCMGRGRLTAAKPGSGGRGREGTLQYYEDLEVGGTTVGTATYLVTEAEIIEMGRRWDPQPFHTDPEAAASSFFGGLVAPTIHLFGITTKLGMDQTSLAAVSNLGMTDVVTRLPVRPGDQLRFESTVLERRPSKSFPGTGVVRIHSRLRNQEDEVVFSFENAALVRFRETAP